MRGCPRVYFGNTCKTNQESGGKDYFVRIFLSVVPVFPVFLVLNFNCKMALKGCFACMKYLVVVFNLIFWLAGIGVLAVSVWLYLDSSVYLQNTDDSYMYFTAVFILMAAGAIMFVIGLLGCCGALQESPCMLGTFFIFLLVIFAAELAGGIWAGMHIKEVHKIIEDQVTKMVKDEYSISKSVDRTIDAMQHDLGCCGARKPSDWAQSRLNGKDNAAIEVGISKSSGFYYVPATCCQTNVLEDCEYHRKVKFSGHDFDGLHLEGCVPRLQRYFEDNLFIIIIIGSVVGVIQLLGLILSITLCCAVRSASSLSAA